MKFIKSLVLGAALSLGLAAHAQNDCDNLNRLSSIYHGKNVVDVPATYGCMPLTNVTTGEVVWVPAKFTPVPVAPVKPSSNFSVTVGMVGAYNYAGGSEFKYPDMGWFVDVTANKYVAAEFEGRISNDSIRQDWGAGGVKFTYPIGRVEPYVKVLEGASFVNAPPGSHHTFGPYPMTVWGGGIDYNFAGHFRARGETTYQQLYMFGNGTSHNAAQVSFGLSYRFGKTI